MLDPTSLLMLTGGWLCPGAYFRTVVVASVGSPGCLCGPGNMGVWEEKVSGASRIPTTQCLQSLQRSGVRTIANGFCQEKGLNRGTKTFGELEEDIRERGTKTDWGFRVGRGADRQEGCGILRQEGIPPQLVLMRNHDLDFLRPPTSSPAGDARSHRRPFIQRTDFTQGVLYSLKIVGFTRPVTPFLRRPPAVGKGISRSLQLSCTPRTRSLDLSLHRRHCHDYRCVRLGSLLLPHHGVTAGHYSVV